MNTLIANPRTSAGFSLIELMIALLVIAVITAIAIPSWEKSVQRSDRSDAKATLNQDAQILERCYTQYFSYTPTGNTCPALITTTQNGYYTILANVAATTYKITATAFAGPPANDKDCYQFTLDNVGNKVAYNSALSTSAAIDAECWGF